MSMLNDWAFETAGYDPIRERYGLSRDDVNRAVATKELELATRTQESTLLGQQLRNASMLAEEHYKLRQRMETDAQLTDAYDALANVSDSANASEIIRRFPAALRDDNFKQYYTDRTALFAERDRAAVEAAKVGNLDEYNRSVSGPEPLSSGAALAGVVDKSVSDSNEAMLEASGVEIPKLADGSVDKNQMNIVRSQLEAEKLAPEERQFALDKWRMLSQRLNNPADAALPEERDAMQAEVLQLEELLDPRKRRSRNAAAPSVPSTIPNDKYFEP